MDSAQRVREISAFVQAVDKGSFAAAGRALRVSSAAISKNIASLEAALGVRLLNRTTRSLILTEEGSAFLGQARIALDALETAMGSVTAEQGGPKGRVRISTSAWFGHEFVLPLLPALLEQHPGLSLEVDFDDRVIDMVKGGYDIAIRGGHIPDSALIARPVCPLRTILVASPGYLERYGLPQTYEELTEHKLIGQRFLGGSVAPWNFSLADGTTVTFDPANTASLTVSSPASLIEAAVANVGIAQVGLLPAWRDLNASKLKIILAHQHVPAEYKMVMHYPHRALLASRVKVTLDYLAQSFESNSMLHIPQSSLDRFAAA